MPGPHELPEPPDLDHVRRQARELHWAAQAGEPDAVARLRRVSDDVSLGAAQLAVAREHGFSSWPALKSAVEGPDEPTGRRGSGGDGDLVKCSFCGKSSRQVERVIAGPAVYICNECVGLCEEILQSENAPSGGRRRGPGAVDRSEPPEVLQDSGGMTVRVRLAEEAGPWTREYPPLARMIGLDARVEERHGHVDVLVRLHDVPREPEMFAALDRALLLVGDAKEVARTHEAVGDRAQRLVSRWWEEKTRE